MNIEVFEGKEEKDILQTVLESYNCTENDIIYYVTTEKGGLLKKAKTELHVAKISDIAEFIKKTLENVITDMGLKVNFETQIRDQQINIKMYSNNNAILIGKDGKTLKALTTYVKQIVFNEINSYPYVLLDVENYKEKQVKYLERLAKNVARDVYKTKQEVALENMNSYERRVIHNILTDDKRVYTESVGEEPNRHIVIKPKKED